MSEISVRTCIAKSSREIAEMMAPHQGKWMTTHIHFNGSLKVMRVRLAAVGGSRVAFWFNGKRHTMDAFEAFGQANVTVEN